jgi:AbrB family looped-hinge helix DNA binding protein
LTLRRLGGKIGVSEIREAGTAMAKAKSVLEEAVRLGAKRQVTIPHRISEALRLKEGDHLLMRLVGGRVEMIPASLIPKDQLWFWTPEWQKKEREVDEALARGEYKESDSVDALLEDLKS